jgi:hypothetical protein
MKHFGPASAIQKIIARLDRLEKAVFAKDSKPGQKPAPSNFSGATGGVRLLVSKSFFSKGKTLGEVRSALAENGYHYSRQAVDMALKGLATRKGPLVILKAGGNNAYVNRK